MTKCRKQKDASAKLDRLCDKETTEKKYNQREEKMLQVKQYKLCFGFIATVVYS